ncbi:MAG: methyltransferase domain-containing protein [Deltaproteobacteria bacterium]|nr:methyltransferase domain-containing protein [Deltaproteobacteria bacterium]
MCDGHRREEGWTLSSGVAIGLCLNCGHAFLARRPLSAALEATYQRFRQSYDDAHLLDQNIQLFQFAKRRQDFIQSHLTGVPGTVLEIGCAYGHFLSLFPEAGLRVGIEPSSGQARFARRNFGLSKVLNTSYQKIESRPDTWPEQGFDLVCSFHVLEHVADPAGLISFAGRFLRPGGWLALAAPNLYTLSPDLIEAFFLHQGLHLHFFQPQTMRNLLAGQGFRPKADLEEEPTSMLRSSFLVLSRFEAGPQPAGPVTDIDQARQALVRFQTSLKANLDCIRAAFKDWTAAGKRVAIFGGGVHTQALLELTGVDPLAVSLIIDDDPDKQGRSLGGIPIRSLEAAMASELDVVVVSSLAAEGLILDRLDRSGLEEVEIKGVYAHLMGRKEDRQSRG